MVEVLLPVVRTHSSFKVVFVYYTSNIQKNKYIFFTGKKQDKIVLFQHKLKKRSLSAPRPHTHNNFINQIAINANFTFWKTVLYNKNKKPYTEPKNIDECIAFTRNYLGIT